MFEELKLVFQAHARVERYDVSDKFYSCKMEENSSVSEHILKMSGLHNRMTQLNINLPEEAVIDRILQSLTKLQELCDELQHAGDGEDHS